MDRRRTLPLLAAAPAVALAAAGLFHPHSLNAETADTWTWLHLVGMFVFPLVGVGLVVSLTGRRDAVAWAIRLGAFVYATAYTALDVISGVTAGYVTSQLPGGAARPPEVSSIFQIGTPVGEVGSWALIAATALLLLDGLRRLRVRGLPMVLLPAGAWAIHSDHIFAPIGVLGMVLVGLGTAYAVHSSGHTPKISDRVGATERPSAAS